jgi:hypothetical protein
MCVVVRNPVISVSEETGRKYYQEVTKKIRIHLLLFYHCCFTIRGNPSNFRKESPSEPPKGLIRTSPLSVSTDLLTDS